VIAAAQRRFGAIHGVIHAAGTVQDGMLQLKTAEAAAAVLRPKVAGAAALQSALHGLPLDWIVCFSSISAVAPRHGQGDYVAANAFLDAWAAAQDRPDGTRVQSINWPGWREVGILSRLTAKTGLESSREADLDRAIATRDGLEAFYRALTVDSSQVVVSPVPPGEWTLPEGAASALETTGSAPEARPRGKQLQEDRSAKSPVGSGAKPTDETGTEPPDELERAVAEIWSEALGFSTPGRTENFLDLGGHSLLAMRIVAQIRAAYQIDFTLRKFFEHPTVAQMAAVIRAEIMAEIEALSDDEATERAL